MDRRSPATPAGVEELGTDWPLRFIQFWILPSEPALATRVQ
jgi:hypothetical protein